MNKQNCLKSKKKKKLNEYAKLFQRFFSNSKLTCLPTQLTQNFFLQSICERSYSSYILTTLNYFRPYF